MHRLDGTPEEFPEREQAMREYARLWEEYKVLCNTSEAERLRFSMDALQLKITKGPGPLWHEFAASLPGYREYWNSFHQWGKRKKAG